MEHAGDFIRKPEILQPYVWLQTSDGSIQQVKQVIAMLFPFIYENICLAMESSMNHPMLLPTQEKKSFDVKVARLGEERFCEYKSAAESLRLNTLIVQEESVEVDENRIRLRNKLNARKMEGLEERDTPKSVDVEENQGDDCSLDDLLSFINGDNEDSKAATSSNCKRKNRKKKNDQKKTDPSHGSTSIVTSSRAAVQNNTDTGDVDSNCSNPNNICNARNMTDIDSKAATSSKHKRKNRKKKNDQKRTVPSNGSTSIGTSSLAVVQNNKNTDEVDPECSNPNNLWNARNVTDTGNDRIAPSEDEFDPARKEATDSLKCKKKNRRKEADQKKTVPSNGSTSMGTSSRAVVQNDDNVDPHCSNPNNLCNARNMTDTGNDTIAPFEGEFDPCGSETDREVEDFKRRLKSAWDEKDQRKCKPLQLARGNSSSKKFPTNFKLQKSAGK